MEKKKSEKYLCIHGHFYQPPRENPWTDAIPIQKSAAPYHDWNERITRECYGPNTRSRLHGNNGYITKLINNYGLINFNFGPTLLNWLEKYHPWIYQQIIKADRESLSRFDNHGNAIAQVYNHIIMPLASKRDKITQIKWGIKDFSHRFDRYPEGMWLAETAVDNETLSIMATEGIKFTILSPSQAHYIKPINEESVNIDTGWKDVSGGTIDCTQPYRCFTDKNSHIDIFFYNAHLSRAIAYEKILSSGEVFLKKISETYPDEITRPTLFNIATDGESYGHHFKFGEMALTWVLEMIDNGADINLTNYGEFLDLFPPENEVRIIENSSWSCAHGIERWRSDCGCSLSQNAEWSQSWRTPLREGLNCLSSQLSIVFEKNTSGILKDSWSARNDYIELLNNPKGLQKAEFIKKHFVNDYNNEESNNLVFRLLESQQMSLFMFTSCGWFFDDISGIEVVQILMYAKRAIELCEGLTDTNLEKGLMEHLSGALGNDPQYPDGKTVYNKMVIPLYIDDFSLTANYAFSSLFNEDHLPFWLRKHISSVHEIRLTKNSINALLCLTEISGKLWKNNNQIIILAVNSSGSKAKCIVGNYNGYDLEILEKELNKKLEGKERGLPFDHFKGIFPDTKIFSFDDLIPDVQRILTDNIAHQLENTISEQLKRHNDILTDYLYMLSKSEESPHQSLNIFFRIILKEKFLNVLQSSDNVYAPLTELKYLINIINKKQDNNVISDELKLFIGDLFRQDDIKKLIQEYLIKLIISSEKINVNNNLNNIIYLLEIINEYDISIDLWEFQNIFYDRFKSRGFMDLLKKESLILLWRIKQLLGFENED